MTLLRDGRSHLVALLPGRYFGKLSTDLRLRRALLEQQTIEVRLDLRNALKLQPKFPQRVGER